MLDPNVIDALIAAGCTVHQIAAAIKADAKASQEKEEERKLARLASGRARQRRYMGKLQQNQRTTDANDASVTSVTVSEENMNKINGHVPGTRPTLSLSSSLKKEESKKERGNAGNIPLPEGWEPNPVHFQKGAELGFSAGQVNDAAEDMRLWAVSSNTRRTLRGWDATLHQFLRRNAKEKTKSLAKDPSTLNGRIRHGII